MWVLSRRLSGSSPGRWPSRALLCFQAGGFAAGGGLAHDGRIAGLGHPPSTWPGSSWLRLTGVCSASGLTPLRPTSWSNAMRLTFWVVGGGDFLRAVARSKRAWASAGVGDGGIADFEAALGGGQLLGQGLLLVWAVVSMSWADSTPKSGLGQTDDEVVFSHLEVCFSDNHGLVSLADGVPAGLVEQRLAGLDADFAGGAADCGNSDRQRSRVRCGSGWFERPTWGNQVERAWSALDSQRTQLVTLRAGRSHRRLWPLGTTQPTLQRERVLTPGAGLRMRRQSAGAQRPGVDCGRVEEAGG